MLGLPMEGSIYKKILNERDHSTQTRMNLLKEIGADCDGKLAICYYGSFQKRDVFLDDNDIAPLEDILQCSDRKKGVLLIVSSPGGLGLAAERMINICKQYSKDNFHVLVPKQAKSAATMVALGADSIYMSQTSELGPIDPQVFQIFGSQEASLPADLIVETYEALVEKAIASTGRIEPLLQQLQAYDSRLVALYKREQKLGKEIAIKALKTGMMKALIETEIEAKIEPFWKAGITSSHGRPIFSKQAKECGLKIVDVDIESELWRKVLELHMRADTVVNTPNYSKLIESSEHHFVAGVPGRK